MNFLLQLIVSSLPMAWRKIGNLTTDLEKKASLHRLESVWNYLGKTDSVRRMPGGEASRIVLAAYRDVSSYGSPMNQKIHESVYALEKKLTEQSVFLKTKGKWGWHVLILVPQNTRSGSWC